jgi:hypothetical protein
MFWVANMIAFNPDAQTLLMVVASEVLGILLSALVYFTKSTDLPSGDTDLPSWTLSNTGRNDISKVDFFNLVG